MTTPKTRATKRKPAPADDGTTVTFRGLSPDDLAGIERQRARIATTRPGEFVPKNAAFLATLRAGIAALDAQHASPAPGAAT